MADTSQDPYSEQQLPYTILNLAKEYLADLLHPEQQKSKNMTMSENALFYNFRELESTLQDAQDLLKKAGKNPPDDPYALLGNTPEGKPFSKDYLKEQFVALAGTHFRKLTDPDYTGTPSDNFDITQTLSAHTDMMNGYLILAEDNPDRLLTYKSKVTRNWATDTKDPDYSKLRNEDGSPVLNPQTKKPYTAADIETVLAGQDEKALKQAWKYMQDQHQVKTETGNDNHNYYSLTADNFTKFDGKVFACSEHMSLVGKNLSNSYQTDGVQLEKILLDAEQNAAPDGHGKKPENYTVRSEDVAKLADHTKNPQNPLSEKIAARDLNALTRAFHAIEDGVTLPDGSLQAPASSTPHAPSRTGPAPAKK